MVFGDEEVHATAASLGILGDQVVNVCKEQLPEWNDGCVEDPRLEVHYDDAKGFLERYEGKFDVIIMDIADPIEAGPG